MLMVSQPVPSLLRGEDNQVAHQALEKTLSKDSSCSFAPSVGGLAGNFSHQREKEVLAEFPTV